MSSHRAICGLASFALLAATYAPDLHASEKRVALVIGNSAYQHTATLSNPTNDAKDIATALRELKFDVIEALNLDKAAMDRTIRQFARSLTGTDVGLFFYAGHGLQVSGQNYLVPTDAKLEDASGLDFELLRMDLVHRTMEREVKTNLLFIDACRDNPLSRNLARAMGTRSAEIGRGLAVVESGVGTLIAFSTQPGNVALDGEGRNSPFAGALVRRIAKPGEDLSTILIAVRNDVMAATRNRQVPWEHSALRARFFFIDAPASGYLDREAAQVLWTTARDTRSPALLQAYVDRYPKAEHHAAAAAMIEQIKKEQSARAELAKREAELRQAEEGRIQAELKKAKEMSLAAEAQRLAAIRAADEAREALKAARAEQEKLAKEGQQTKLAAVPAGLVTDAPENRMSLLARSLQGELKRVGCYAGAVDGRWDAQTKQALRDFARIAKVAVSGDDPTEQALEAVIGQKNRVCAAKCAPGETEKDGKCVARAKPKTQPRDSQVGSAKAEPERSSSSLCWNPIGAAGPMVPCTGRPGETRASK